MSFIRRSAPRRRSWRIWRPSMASMQIEGYAAKFWLRVMNDVGRPGLRRGSFSCAATSSTGSRDELALPRKPSSASPVFPIQATVQTLHRRRIFSRHSLEFKPPISDRRAVAAALKDGSTAPSTRSSDRLHARTLRGPGGVPERQPAGAGHQHGGAFDPADCNWAKESLFSGVGLGREVGYPFYAFHPDVRRFGSYMTNATRGAELKTPQSRSTPAGHFPGTDEGCGDEIPLFHDVLNRSEKEWTMPARRMVASQGVTVRHLQPCSANASPAAMA